MPTRYYISLPDPARARGSDAALAFRAQGADGFADELQAALRTGDLFERWRTRLQPVGVTGIDWQDWSYYPH